MQPVFTIYMGMNGSGKSTLFPYYKVKGGVDYINPDLIMKWFGLDWHNNADALRVGKMALVKIKQDIEARKNLAIETTCFLNNPIQMAKKAGYLIDVRFVLVEDINLALNRIVKREKEGGHGIPTEITQVAYRKQESNLIKAIQEANHLVVYENVNGVRKIAEFINSNPLYIKNDFVKSCYEKAMENNRVL